MATDYARICRDRETQYGTDGAQELGEMTAELLYDDRTHFIYELLQNAEDALGRREPSWNGERKVSFHLEDDALRVVHYGSPFNEGDVEAICRFLRSTKDSLTEIGRFGIGFKSVYAYTREPMVHSGAEHFKIQDYVYPRGISASQHCCADSTVFELPFRTDIPSAYEEIYRGLRTVHRRTLLFLRHIEEITWKTDKGMLGHYLRESQQIDEEVYHTTLISEDTISEDTDSALETEQWLVFDREVEHNGKPAGKVHVAYLLEGQAERVQAVSGCTLFAWFPTGLETHMGLLLDGPYRTTLDRSQVPLDDCWNRHLAEKTAALVVDSLRWLRDKERLDAAVLRCLPLTAPQADSRQAFLQPIFDETRKALNSERLLPRHGGGYATRAEALMSRTVGLRELFSSRQLAALYELGSVWLDGSLSEANDLQDYIRHELDIRELRLENVLPKLTDEFLEEQSDEWIVKLLTFLYGQRAEWKRLTGVSLVRLEDGRHVVPMIDGSPQAFLPPKGDDDLTSRVDRSIVHPRICEDDNAVRLLREMGISEWDAVDDVINRILPKYQTEAISYSEDNRSADIAHILEAYRSSTGNKKTRLVGELRDCAFVPAVAATGDAERVWHRADAVYLPTERLRVLFDGVESVWFADLQVLGDDHDAEESLRELLLHCGASTTLRTKRFRNRGRFTDDELETMRYSSQLHYDYPRSYTYDDDPIDYRLCDLNTILTKLSNSNHDEQMVKARSLWSCLSELPRNDFEGRYRWFYYTDHSSRFMSEFVNTLNSTRWVPLPNGCLGRPSDAVFEELGWPPDRLLQEFLDFRPPSPERSRREELASEAGIDDEYLDFALRAQEQGVSPNELSRWLDERHGRTASTPAGPPGDLDAGSFLEALLGRQASGLQNGDQRAPVTFPTGGPNTRASAAADTTRSVELVRQEGWQIREVSHRERGPEGRALADEFRDMVKGDYGRRCQICGSTFTKPDGEPQVFIVHLVAPSRHMRTNNFGNLLGLCGWHFALVQHGQSQIMTIEQDSPIDDPEQLTELILNLPEEIDETGNPYRALPIRFWSVYSKWASEPSIINAKIRYSLPHWEYLCALVKDD